ncbi:MAG: precorrin-3B C(17)-methyltransferase [Deltaproteobacteria bacterium]|nr:MAG: precorrin-3B C(17)-methyltransferase [Deltaproteobacteria bacterium]
MNEPRAQTPPRPGGAGEDPSPHARRGKLLLVGFGPGAHDHLSFRARAAIAEAEVVIGYSTYIKLIADLLDGKEVHRKGMSEELDRVHLAYDLALEGRTVALISSGDICVYGMAGPALEVLAARGWRGLDDERVEVEVVPGISAVNAVASLVGAPLTHDYCTISLSDLLTPWPVIERRVIAATEGDFVIALYNPQSKRRTWQLPRTVELMLEHGRAPHTPVAIVKSAYRKRQNIVLTTLDDLCNHPIGMLTTVLIGNSHTRFTAGRMVTPRGYGNKYDVETGALREGQQRLRSLRLDADGRPIGAAPEGT